MKSHPVVIIGAGPAGLAAAAHLVSRNLDFVILERGPSAGHAVRDWSHVRLFSPWRYALDREAMRLLEQDGWTSPPQDELPTGADLLRDYLEPLAALPVMQPRIRYDALVTSVARDGFDKVTTRLRERRPFVVRYRTGDGVEHELLASALLDASGTWWNPNPAGSSGLPAPGERERADVVDYGLPDVLGKRRADFAGRHVAVIGSGHSAIHAVLDLVALAPGPAADEGGDPAAPAPTAPRRHGGAAVGPARLRLSSFWPSRPRPAPGCRRPSRSTRGFMTAPVSDDSWTDLRRRLVAFVRRRIDDEALAEDVVQEVLLRGHRALGELQRPERLHAWLFQATRNALIDRFRTARPTEPLPPDFDLPKPPSATEPSELSRCMAPLVRQLPAPYREALELAELQELPQREVAARLGLSLSGAKSRMQRGRRLLADALHACCAIEVDARGAPVAFESRGHSSCGCAPGVED